VSGERTECGLVVLGEGWCTEWGENIVCSRVVKGRLLY
jgi:hypothetical protein